MAKEPDKRIQAKVLKAIETFDLPKLKVLFRDILNYTPADSPVVTDKWTSTAQGLIKDPPRIVASAGRSKPPFQVIHIKMKTKGRLLLLEERTVVSQLLKSAPFGLYAFSDSTELVWHLVNVRHDGRTDVGKRFIFRRISLGKDDRLLTASERLALLELDDPTGSSVIGIQNIHDQAFNVEAVTDMFFKEYKALFDKTKLDLQKVLTKDHKARSEFEDKFGVAFATEKAVAGGRFEEWNDRVLEPFCQKLMSQIVFLYFIQRKGWLGVPKDEDWGSGSKDFLRRLLSESKYSNFFDDILEPLFYDALATKHNRDYYPLFDCKIPFLNGGLFSPINDYDWTSTNLLLPNELFSNDEYSARGYRGTGILDVFDRYNFTVKEDEPLDKEVAVDPEMLGKIFESLLVKERRKKTGTYYTTREVVHFICQESLLHYLVNELGIPQEDVAAYIQYEEGMDEELSASIKENADLFDEALSEVRVLDPAVGSGAFPVGIMMEVVRLRSVLSPFIPAENRTPYDFKQHAIQNSIYGVDIEPISTEVAKLRMWLSLVVDEDNPKKVKPLPNLDFKVICGDSLPSGQFVKTELLYDLDELENRYFEETDREKKNEYQTRIAELVEEITEGSPDIEVYFSKVFREKKGFDIVIGNPPWGLKVDEELKRYYQLGNRESYGIFMAKAISRLLKPNGILGFIVHDTWLTIRTHRELREKVLAGTLKTVVQFNDDCFEGAAYTGKPGVLLWQNAPSDGSLLVAADLTQILTKQEVVELREKLAGLNNFVGQSSDKFAVYQYPQELISANSNIPIFIGSPRLFALMNDTTCKKEWREAGGQRIQVRQIELNDKMVELVRFGDVAEVKQGLATGDNDSYLFQNPNAKGSYKSIEAYQDLVLTDEDLDKIRIDNAVRLKVVDKGIHKIEKEASFDRDCYFEGRFIVPYDKGGESDTSIGWLPNYYVPTDYYIDWSTDAVHRMKTLTMAERDKDKGKNKDRDKICSRFQNSDSYFKKGITFSSRGVYSPSYRVSSASVFDKESSCFFSHLDLTLLLGLLGSKSSRYLFRNYCQHTVSTDVDALKELPFSLTSNPEVERFVSQIIAMQEKDPRYDYASNEQKQIDLLVYEMFGLSEDDIEEVETWYRRRYPRLVRNDEGDRDA